MDGGKANVPVRQRIEGPAAWRRDTLSPADWTVKLGREALAELRAVLAELRRSPLPYYLVDPADYALDACRATMNEVRKATDEGVLFAVLDRLPVEEMTRDEAVQLYWLLSSLLSRPVAQKWNGSMLFEVRDTGAKMKPGSGIRPTVTNVDLTFHNDNSYNETPPDYVALLCLQRARSGGVSRVMSVVTLHNELLERHPQLLERLYRPFWFDRHAEHAPGDQTVFAAPLFETKDGRVMGRCAILEIRGGAELRGEKLDPEGEAALRAVEETFRRPELYAELELQPGQIEYVNNRSTGHARTEFVDGETAEEKRHLVRLWLRDRGRRSYRG